MTDCAFNCGGAGVETALGSWKVDVNELEDDVFAKALTGDMSTAVIRVADIPIHSRLCFTTVKASALPLYRVKTASV